MTQEDPTQPRAKRQVAYDEQALDDAGRKWVFFFHYLELSPPLLTSAGPLRLPAPTPLPRRLRHVEYCEP